GGGGRRRRRGARRPGGGRPPVQGRRGTWGTGGRGSRAGAGAAAPKYSSVYIHARREERSQTAADGLVTWGDGGCRPWARAEAGDLRRGAQAPHPLRPRPGLTICHLKNPALTRWVGRWSPVAGLLE